MAIELVFLGTGTSAGVPMIGCDCDVCRSPDPRDHRTRPSVLIRYNEAQAKPIAASDDAAKPMQRQFIIDAAVEMRQQVIRHRVNRIDGVFITHAHADHIFGLDDLRRFNAVMGEAIDVYTESSTHNYLKQIFPYVFAEGHNPNRGFVPKLVPQSIAPGETIGRFGARWRAIRLMHGRMPILGFRIDLAGQSLAYCTDVSTIPDESMADLEGLDVLVIDALRYREHPTHMTVDQALEVIDRVKPKRAYFTHIAHDIMHAELEPKLPEHVFLSFDGLVVSTGDARQPG